MQNQADSRFNFSDMSMMIVDGNAFARSFTANICKSFRFGTVVEIEDPMAALESLMERDIDVIITEWETRPLGGEEFVRCIRGMKGVRNHCVPVIALTAACDVETVANARDCGTTEFLTRPLVLPILLARLTHVFTSPRPFVRSPDYSGPDRRRKQRSFCGSERRGARAVPPAPIPESLLATVEKLQRQGGLTLNELAEAGEAVIAQEEVRYRDVRTQDLRELVDMVEEFKRSTSPPGELLERIYLKSHDIKGMGKTFGFPLLTAAGDSLCKLLWKLPAERSTMAIIRQGVETHVTVMNLIVDKNVRDDGGKAGAELVAGLHSIVAVASGTDRPAAGAGSTL